VAKNLVPVDSGTMVACQDIWVQSQVHGFSWIEELNRNNLLLTPYMKAKIYREALQGLLDQIQIWRPHEMLRRKYHAGHQTTPADMMVVMCEFIEEYITRVKDE